MDDTKEKSLNLISHLNTEKRFLFLTREVRRQTILISYGSNFLLSTDDQ